MIEKITDQNLERYDSRLKEWCDKKLFEKGNYGKYQTTEEAGAVAFYPAPDTPLEGKVKFSFKETMPTNGDKGPDNPSTIDGVSEIEVVKTGKNLAPTAIGGMNYNDGIIVSNNDGSFTLNGTTRQNATMYVGLINPSSSFVNYKEGFLRHGCTYTFSVTSSSGVARSDITLSMYKTVNGTFDWINRVFGLRHGESATYTILPNTAYHLRFNIAPNATFNNETFFVQIEKEESPSAFEESLVKQSGVIDLNDTYYGGIVDLTTGVMTITHVECVADGTNIYAQSSVDPIGVSYRHAINVVTFGLPAPIIGDYESSSSTHFTCVNSLVRSFGVFSQASHFIIVCDKDGLYPTNQSFNDWLKAQNASGTPVKFVYTIANPFTVSLTPLQLSALSQFDKYTPKLNTVYTNADSVQISYLKSPIRDEYEKTQAILSLGGNS